MANGHRGARVRAAAATVVDAVASSGRSLDVALAAEEEKIAEQDRPLLRALSFGTVRHYWRIQYFIRQLLDKPLKNRDSIVNALLAVGIYQLTDMRIPDHAAVSETVEAARPLRRPRHAGLLNAVLRRFMREDLAAQEPDDEQARYDHPTWLIDALRADWPDDWQAILDANNARAPMWLRPNRRRGDTDAYLSRLAEADIAASSGPGDALQLAEPRPVAELPGFADGDVSVQDAAAQLAAPWLLAGDGNRLLDACAAPGGKSAHLLELGGETLDLTSVDIDESRLVSIGENFDRLGLSATVIAGDASTPETWWDGKRFDGILLDAPCSASGVIRRHPDIKLLRRAGDIDRLGATQAGILRALWPLLEAGGRLLYVTCSVLRAENEAVVGDFLGSTPDARENDMLPNNNIRDVMRRMACGYQVLPGTAGLDGFYFACLEKVS